MKPFHDDVKDPAGLALARRSLADQTHLSQGRSPSARRISGLVVGADLEHRHGSDLPYRDRSRNTLQTRISKIFMGRMPRASAHA